MDILLRYCDEALFDNAYAKLFPLAPGLTTNTTGASAQFLSSLSRDNDIRITTSLFIITCIGGWLIYLTFASLSYFLVYDHDQMKHPRFLKNQIQLELESALSAVPGYTVFTLPWFWAEVKGYSNLYDNISDYGLGYWIFSIFAFLFFTDMCIYWIHRWLHIPWIYKRFHKPHHKWIIPTPYASHAFHPFDGYMQSVPYHLFVFLLPLHKYLYLGLFIFINIWTIMIHDGAYMLKSSIINSAAHHSVHHLYFNYNYGQYSTLWDRIGGSHQQPTEEQYDSEMRKDRSVWRKQSAKTDKIESMADPDVKAKSQ